VGTAVGPLFFYFFLKNYLPCVEDSARQTNCVCSCRLFGWRPFVSFLLPSTGFDARQSARQTLFTMQIGVVRLLPCILWKKRTAKALPGVFSPLLCAFGA
jgi:hypothetical protein